MASHMSNLHKLELHLQTLKTIQNVLSTERRKEMNIYRKNDLLQKEMKNAKEIKDTMNEISDLKKKMASKLGSAPSVPRPEEFKFDLDIEDDPEYDKEMEKMFANLKLRMRVRKTRRSLRSKSRKVRKSRKSRKVRKSRKSRKVRKSRRSVRKSRKSRKSLKVRKSRKARKSRKSRKVRK